MFNKKKHNDKWLGQYPAINYLNNAIRFILDGNTETAIQEIIYAMAKADGYIVDDVREKLFEHDDYYKTTMRSYFEQLKP